MQIKCLLLLIPVAPLTHIQFNINFKTGFIYSFPSHHVSQLSSLLLAHLINTLVVIYCQLRNGNNIKVPSKVNVAARVCDKRKKNLKL